MAVIEETALSRPADPRIRRGQVRHLLQMSRHPGVTIRVNLTSAGSYAVPGSFRLLHFAAPDLPDLVYVEHLTGASYLDRPSDTGTYQEAMRMLASQSATPDATRGILRQQLADLACEHR
jgi:hypothetical protein